MVQLRLLLQQVVVVAAVAVAHLALLVEQEHQAKEIMVAQV